MSGVVRGLVAVVVLSNLVLAGPAAGAAEPRPHGLKVPPGFAVTEFAGSELADDIYCLTVDDRGRVFVASRNYIRILADDDGDGRADRAVAFADGPRDGATGLLVEGDTVYVTGDGGLRRYRDADADGKADGPSEMLRPLKTGGEHAAHALRRGPDGWLYLLAGNNTGIDRSYATLPTSPVRDPVAGCVLRFPPDLQGSEIVADGFRNPYGMDFNPDGELFTYDSDNERCVSLPWYEGTRFYHVRPGGHYGWQNPQHGQFWRMPPYFFDAVAPVLDLGRGSPTGVACYRHAQFPPAYRGGFFLGEWTFGRVYFLALRRSGSSYTGTREVFLEATGDNGFAPTACAVHPLTGDLYVSIGGRGTRGAVYRVRYPQGFGKVDPAEVAKLQPRPRKHGDGEAPAVSVRTPPSPTECLTRALRGLEKGDAEPAERLAAVRWVQLAHGGLTSPDVHNTVWEGYSPRRPGPLSGEALTLQDRVRRRLLATFPTGHADLDREIGRTFAVLADDTPEALAKIAALLTPASHPVDDIHHLIVLARLRAARPQDLTAQVAARLLDLDRKLNERHSNRDRNWPLRVAELHAELARQDPRLNDALVRHPEFGRPDHAVFTQAPGSDRRRAAAVFLGRAAKDPEYPWNPGLVALLGHLPDEQALPVLRRLGDQGGLDEAVLRLLARRPAAEDRERFLRGLESPQLETARVALDALEKLPPRRDPGDLLALVRAARRLADDKAEKPLRERVARHLARVTGESGVGPEPRAWSEWFAKKYPEQAARLGDADGVDGAAWERRLAALDWSRGDAGRGAAVFVQAGCAACHSGIQALGPDLRGVGGRFSRADLMTAILRPSKDVSSRYRTTLMATAEGKVYQGLIVYEAVDSVILQTGTAGTVRLSNTQITEKRLTNTSLMPAGLLDRRTDREVADLYAYLKGFK